MNRAHDGATGDAVALERSCHLVEAHASLRSTWMPTLGASATNHARASSNVGGSARAREAHRASPADATSRSPMAHLREVVRVRDDEWAALERDHIELDDVDAELGRRPERVKRVLRSECCSTPVRDDERTACAARKVDHAARKRGGPGGRVRVRRRTGAGLRRRSRTPSRETRSDEHSTTSQKRSPATASPGGARTRATPRAVESIRPVRRHADRAARALSVS